MKLWEYLRSKMQSNLSQEICEDGARITFEEAVIFAEEFAKRLRGIKCCAILCKSEMAAGMALLSCFAAEVTALPLSERYGAIHCNKILDAVSPDAVITVKDGEFQVIRIKDYKYNKPDIHPALIMCTSGTTGIPKGAMLTETNIITNVSDISAYFGIGRLDTILISRPLYHSAVLTGEFLTSLVKGAKIRFYSGNFNPPIILKMLKDYNITAFCGTPTLISMMAKFKRNEVYKFLKHICISGECMGDYVRRQILKSFSEADIYHVYGLTEASPRVAYLPPSLFKDYGDFVGIPLRSVKVKIILPNGKTAAPNEVGILWVKGDNVMAGYYNNPQKTAETLCDGWLCTGDLALVNEVGLIKIKGRSDDLIIKAGMNIYPQEIENALMLDPRVREISAFGVTDTKVGTQIVLNIAGDFLNTDEVKALCCKSLPSYQIPSKINLLEEIPKNGSGKIIRR